MRLNPEWWINSVAVCDQCGYYIQKDDGMTVVIRHEQEYHFCQNWGDQCRQEYVWPDQRRVALNAGQYNG